MAQLSAVLDALHALCAQGQVMVDLFVNYDCDLQAANLFERSMRGLSKLLKKGPPTSVFAGQQASKTRDVALDALLAMLTSLNAWAEPLKVRSRSANVNAKCKRVCRAFASCQLHMPVFASVSSSLQVWLQKCLQVCSYTCARKSARISVGLQGFL